MNAQFFKTQFDFRRWLEKNHQTATEIIVGYYKIDSGKASMTWSESVDQALCFGWIDGIRRRIDHESYSGRFTPRRLKSNWSAVNIAKMSVLIKKGWMTPAGIAAFKRYLERNKKTNNKPKRKISIKKRKISIKKRKISIKRK